MNGVSGIRSCISLVSDQINSLWYQIMNLSGHIYTVFIQWFSRKLKQTWKSSVVLESLTSFTYITYILPTCWPTEWLTQGSSKVTTQQWWGLKTWDVKKHSVTHTDQGRSLKKRETFKYAHLTQDPNSPTAKNIRHFPWTEPDWFRKFMDPFKELADQ